MQRRKQNLRSKVLKVARIIDRRKGSDLLVLDMRKVSTMTDYFIITTGNSITHLHSMVKYIIEGIKEKPQNPIKNIENSWILLDYGDFIVHLFLKETREFYGLENLWADAVKINYERK